MKVFGRRHRPFYRVCVTDARTPRDGRVLEEVGYYDPMVPETDARAILKGERIDYWLSVGAQPSEKVAVLIKKYGTNGTHLEQQQAAVERLAAKRRRQGVPADLPKTEQIARKKKGEKKVAETVAEEVPPVVEETAVKEAVAEETVAEETVEVVAAVPVEEAVVETAAPVEETPVEETAPAEEDAAPTAEAESKPIGESGTAETDKE